MPAPAAACVGRLGARITIEHGLACSVTPANDHRWQVDVGPFPGDRQGHRSLRAGRRTEKFEPVSVSRECGSLTSVRSAVG